VKEPGFQKKPARGERAHPENKNGKSQELKKKEETREKGFTQGEKGRNVFPEKIPTRNIRKNCTGGG